MELIIAAVNCKKQHIFYEIKSKKTIHSKKQTYIPEKGTFQDNLFITIIFN